MICDAIKNGICGNDESRIYKISNNGEFTKWNLEI